MEALKDLNEQLGNPSTAKLYAAAKKKGIPVTRTQVNELVKGQSARQVFAKPMPEKGSQAAISKGDRWQADLIDFKQFKASNNENNKYALVVTDVFTRKTASAPLKTKAQEEVLAAFRSLVPKLGGKPSRLDTDGGEEFSGGFREAVEGMGIAVQTRSPSDTNFLAVNDRAIQTVKESMSRAMAKSGTTKWVDKLGKSTDAHNKTPHSSLMNESPEDADKQPVVQFRLMQDNARKLRQNAAQLKRRQDSLESNGAFRVRLPKQTFARGAQVKWGNEVHNVASIKLGQVVDTAGKTYQISKVLPVAKGSAPANVPKALASGSEARSAKQTEVLSKFKGPLREYLGNESKGLAAVGTFLRGRPGFEKALADLRMNRPGGMRAAVEAIDRQIQITGVGQPTVRVRPQARLRGKQ